jgi:hypothetical protein
MTNATEYGQVINDVAGKYTFFSGFKSSINEDLLRLEMK